MIPAREEQPTILDAIIECGQFIAMAVVLWVLCQLPVWLGF